MKAVDWMFVGEHYRPGIEILGALTVHSCRECAALVDSSLVEEHVAWHKTQKEEPREVVHHRADRWEGLP